VLGGCRNITDQLSPDEPLNNVGPTDVQTSTFKAIIILVSI